MDVEVVHAWAGVDAGGYGGGPVAQWGEGLL